MFPDGMYYVTTNHGGGPMAVIVRGMSMIEFFHEFRDRFSRYPYIYSTVPLDEDEFEEFLEVFENDNNDAVFDNGVYDDN